MARRSSGRSLGRQRGPHRHHAAADVDADRRRDDRLVRRDDAADRRADAPVDVGHRRDPLVDERQRATLASCCSALSSMGTPRTQALIGARSVSIAGWGHGVLLARFLGKARPVARCRERSRPPSLRAIQTNPQCRSSVAACEQLTIASRPRRIGISIQRDVLSHGIDRTRKLSSSACSATTLDTGTAATAGSAGGRPSTSASTRTCSVDRFELLYQRKAPDAGASGRGGHRASVSPETEVATHAVSTSRRPVGLRGGLRDAARLRPGVSV